MVSDKHLTPQVIINNNHYFNTLHLLTTRSHSNCSKQLLGVITSLESLRGTAVLVLSPSNSYDLTRVASDGPAQTRCHSM